MFWKIKMELEVKSNFGIAAKFIPLLDNIFEWF
jgi:hypothetical protein